MDINELYQEIIIDHGTQPRNCCELHHANQTADGFNPLCGDKIRVFLHVKEGVVQEASFTGSGCAISTACASLLTEALPGKEIHQAKALCNEFTETLKSGAPPSEQLGKLAALLGVKAFPSRVKCATLPCHTFEAALRQLSTTITTESSDDNP